MSTGGVFKLIANDGKADRIIMATELLNHRLKQIMCMRQKQGLADNTPTLVDIERTHILYVNSHFKPFAAIGYEYGKTGTQTGTPNWAGTTQFSIPQFGDFFSDMVLHTTLASTSATVGTVPAFPAYIGLLDQVTTATSKVSATTDTVNGVYTKYTQEYVDLAGNVYAVGDAISNFVRYAEYPGQRFAKKIAFDVNGNPLDDYTPEAYMFKQKFEIAPHKATGWKRLMGQEVPVEAYTDLVSVAGASAYPANVSNLLDVNGAAATGAATSATITARKLLQVVNGAQTPKATQPALDLWIPLIFWFNEDTRLSVPSVSIPYGQRYITVDICNQNELLFTAPPNLFLRLTVEKQTSADLGSKGTAAAIAVQDVKKYQTLTPVLATGSVINTSQQISKLELYINNIFLNPEIHDIYIKRIGFSLIRVHRLHKQRLSVEKDQVLMSSLKWPIEVIYTGIRPAYNVDASNPNQYRDWHRFTRLNDKYIDTTSRSAVDVMIDDTVAFNAASAKHKTASNQMAVERLTYVEQTETVNELSIEAHGIFIYRELPSTFFRDYTSYIYGDVNIVTPEDLGALMVNFCLYPKRYNPSGHINTSRVREFYLHYSSSYVSPSTPSDLLALGIALNFLLISDGSAVLRYST